MEEQLTLFDYAGDAPTRKDGAFQVANDLAVPTSPVPSELVAQVTPDAIAWYSIVDDEYYRDTGCHLGISNEEIARWYERHIRDQKQEGKKQEPETDTLALYQGLFIRRKPDDGCVYRVTGWTGIPSLNGVAVRRITADLRPIGTLRGNVIPPGIIISCCLNPDGPQQFVYRYKSEEVERVIPPLRDDAA